MGGVRADNNKNNKVLWRWCVLVMAMVEINICVVDGIGVNWGTMMAQPLFPGTVVQMLKDNGIKKVKLFDADNWDVSALAGSGIEVIVAIPNNELDPISKDYDNAKDWVKENVTRHLKDTGGVDIRYVAVGNEPFLKSYNGSFLKSTFPALKNIQKALDEAGVGDKIKATIPSNADVYESSSTKPSDGNFRKDIRPLMVDIVKFLNSNKSPFIVNIYPFLSLFQDPNFPVNYAFFDGGSTPTNDGNNQYTNVFDANYDTLVWSLKKAGVPNLKVAVGEIGWPTSGGLYGNISSAKRFYDGFLKKMGSHKGTPLRQDAYDDVYLFGLLDENLKSVAPGIFERHWGIFGYDGKPKFPIDFSGKGNEKMPVGAKGVQYLQSQWCVYNKDNSNMSLVTDNVNFACSLADCTPLMYRSSCNHLDTNGNVSYAFNIYFQMQGQDVEACDFQGLAEITKVNPSEKGCVFPIQIASIGHRTKLEAAATMLMLILFIM